MIRALIRFDNNVVAFVGLACALLICALLRTRGHHRGALVVWCVALLLGSVPFTDFQTQPLWIRASWIPFWHWTVKDAVINVLLYVPLGFFLNRERYAVSTVVAFAAVLSIAAESSQLFSRSRFPAATDVVCNMIGASIGVLLARVTERSTTSVGAALKSAIRRCMA